jgi:hypothetical protein
MRTSANLRSVCRKTSCSIVDAGVLWRDDRALGRASLRKDVLAVFLDEAFFDVFFFAKCVRRFGDLFNFRFLGN